MQKENDGRLMIRNRGLENGTYAHSTDSFWNKG
ncbi:MAG: hypothetical protein ACI828_001201 [Flavobacteriales bacterium]|jgi:hypothetical protein